MLHAFCCSRIGLNIIDIHSLGTEYESCIPKLTTRLASMSRNAAHNDGLGFSPCLVPLSVTKVILHPRGPLNVMEEADVFGIHKGPSSPMY